MVTYPSKFFLSVDFNREITMTETYVYHDEFKGELYHRSMADMILRTLKELET